MQNISYRVIYSGFLKSLRSFYLGSLTILVYKGTSLTGFFVYLSGNVRSP